MKQITFKHKCDHYGCAGEVLAIVLRVDDKSCKVRLSGVPGCLESFLENNFLAWFGQEPPTKEVGTKKTITFSPELAVALRYVVAHNKLAQWERRQAERKMDRTFLFAAQF